VMKHKTMRHRSQRGFTIVELLIVIVVIAILAAIVIVAYTGIQNKAHTAAAQAASNAVAKLLTNSYTTNGAYPADLSTINNGGPMPTTDGSTYVYHPGSGNSSYCVTVTNGNSSYKVADGATQPTAGGCPGDGVNGVAPVTNLAINPSAATAATYWSTNGAAAATSRDASASRPGSLTTGSVKTTFTSAATVSTQLWDGSTTPLVPTSPGDTVTISGWVMSSVAGRTLTIGDRWRDSSNTQVSQVASSNISVPSTWTRVTYTAQAPSGTAYDHISFYFNGQAGDAWWLDDVMVTKGGTDYTYADGNTPNWVWNGTVNNSTSTGPAQ
jgi:prepilin-type N-terminal cleavage/methylation domain-containing protein